MSHKSIFVRVEQVNRYKCTASLYKGFADIIAVVVRLVFTTFTCDEWRFQGVLNAAARLIFRKKKHDSITSTLRCQFDSLSITFNCRHNLAPGFLTTMCHAVSEIPGRHIHHCCCWWMKVWEFVPLNQESTFQLHGQLNQIGVAGKLSTEARPRRRSQVNGVKVRAVWRRHSLSTFRNRLKTFCFRSSYPSS